MTDDALAVAVAEGGVFIRRDGEHVATESLAPTRAIRDGDRVGTAEITLTAGDLVQVRRSVRERELAELASLRLEVAELRAGMQV